MENCDVSEQYKNYTNSRVRRYEITWTVFRRQMFVVSGVWVIYFSLGLSFGAPTVLITQMRREANSSAVVSPEMESWLSSIHGYSSLPFVIILPISALKFGRKIPITLICLNSIIANIIFYCSATTMHVLISEMMQGVLLAGNITLLLPTCSEYALTHYRGMFLTIKAALFFWGVWVANAVGTFMHWKNIGIIGIVCGVYSLSVIFWPESPSWYAMKGRYEEAIAAHHWLKGYDEASEKELENLISSQKQQRETSQKCKSKTFKEKCTQIFNMIKSKAFHYPLLLTMATMSLYHFSGKFVCVMYAVQLIHQITNSEETAYLGMLLLEGITILGMSVGCFLSKYMGRKTLLLSSSSVAAVSLYVISLYLYLISLGVFLENTYISLLLLVIFSVTISCGPLIIASPIFGEIVSLKYRCSTLLTLTFYSELLMATILKLAPSIFKLCGLHGAFMFFAIFASIFIFILFKYLPETKGKTLIEIEEMFNETQPTDVEINLLESKKHDL